MPEVEAIVENETGFFFNENDIKSLQTQMLKVIKSKINFKVECRKVIDNNYNPKNQVEILKAVL